MLDQISLNTIVMDSVYLVSLMATDENNISKTIRMPIDKESPTGLILSNLIEQTWNYIPNANPDILSQTKAKKLEFVNSQWAALEKTGWTSAQGFKLGITSSDVALLVGVYSLAKEAAALGLAIPPIIAMDNMKINFQDITEMTGLLLQYGAARSQMSEEFAAKRKAIQEATTIEQVDAI